MADIFLEIPDDVMAGLEHRAALLGKDVEDFVRGIIEASAPVSKTSDPAGPPDLQDEPIVRAAEIEKEYRRLGYRLGWRFITCPQAYAKHAKLLVVSLNPAGRSTRGPSWSQEEGSAYRVESWNGLRPGASALQLQVQRMLAFLELTDDEVFSAHYVPFRSPSWADLDRKEDAERFARDLWRWLQPQLSFQRIVCIGKDKPGRPMAGLFEAEYEASMPTGWGNVTADRYRLADGRPLIALPHLSRFGLFGRSEGEQALLELFEL
jgi:hypothetical protein